MTSMRSLALVFLCFCLAVAGTATAVPMAGMAMDATGAMSMAPDCPDMADVTAMPPVDEDAAPVDKTKPDCCRSASCACAAAHLGFLAFPPLLLPRAAPTATIIAATGGSGYTSPALARLIRPPIS